MISNQHASVHPEDITSNHPTFVHPAAGPSQPNRGHNQHLNCISFLSCCSVSQLRGMGVTQYVQFVLYTDEHFHRVKGLFVWLFFVCFVLRFICNCTLMNTFYRAKRLFVGLLKNKPKNLYIYLYAIVHGQTHSIKSIGWKDHVCDCFLLPRQKGSHTPPLEDLSPFLDGGCGYAKSLSCLYIYTYLCTWGVGVLGGGGCYTMCAFYQQASVDCNVDTTSVRLKSPPPPPPRLIFFTGRVELILLS